MTPERPGEAGFPCQGEMSRRDKGGRDHRALHDANNEPNWAPTKARRSGFCGERTSSGMSEPWHLCRGERYVVCEDDVGADIIRPFVPV